MTSPRLFVHQHYDALKLLGISLNLVIAVGLLLYAFNLSNDGQRRTNEATQQIVQATKDENDRQTDILNKQLDNQRRQARAQCILLFKLIGAEELANINPSVKNDCLSLVGNETSDQFSLEVSPSTQTTPAQAEPDTAKTKQPTTSAPPSSNGKSDAKAKTSAQQNQPTFLERLLAPFMQLTRVLGL